MSEREHEMAPYFGLARGANTGRYPKRQLEPAQCPEFTVLFHQPRRFVRGSEERSLLLLIVCAVVLCGAASFVPPPSCFSPRIPLPCVPHILS